MHPEDSGASDVPGFTGTVRFTNQLILIPNLLPNPLSILVCVESNQIRASNLILRAAKEKWREGEKGGKVRVRPWRKQSGPMTGLAHARTRASRLMTGKKNGYEERSGLVFQQGHWIPLNQ